MIITYCRRCGTRHDGDDFDAWQDAHECVPLARRRIELLPTNAPEPIPHGDARRYTSTLQRCRCPRCTSAYLESKERYRALDFRVAPRKRQRH